jgi:hypothetical protein
MVQIRIRLSNGNPCTSAESTKGAHTGKVRHFHEIFMNSHISREETNRCFEQIISNNKNLERLSLWGIYDKNDVNKIMKAVAEHPNITQLDLGLNVHHISSIAEVLVSDEII